jgi:hypothetical protein
MSIKVCEIQVTCYSDKNVFKVVSGHKGTTFPVICWNGKL